MQNKPIKKIFVCEFITGGGFNHSDLHQELANQGQLMRDALLHNLSHLPYQVYTTVDARLMLPTNCEIYKIIDADVDVWQVWEEAIEAANAVWLIAPETDGYLEKITALALKHKKIILGCGLNSVIACSLKSVMFQLLKEAGIATLQTCSFSEWQKTMGCKWLAKPDDGAGCEETVCYDNANDLERWLRLNNKLETHVIQPYLAGCPASISCVMHHGQAYMLSCNKQLIEKENNKLRYKGCVVNGMRAYWHAFEMLANKIAQVLPDLAGYVGIDVIVGNADMQQKQITVVEINPRLTTSYVALNEATGLNSAELIVNLLTQQGFAWPVIAQNEVTLEIS